MKILIPDKLARAERPGYPSETVGSAEVQSAMASWRDAGIRGILCLLDASELAHYADLPNGLLEGYSAAGFGVAHIPLPVGMPETMDDPTKEAVREAWKALPKPVLVQGGGDGDARTEAVVYALAAPDAYGIRVVDEVPEEAHPRHERKVTGEGNALRVIHPYQHAGTWVFDDPAAGLEREPFVVGVPEMIDGLVAGIPDAAKGFRLLFSARAFPGAQHTLVRLREDFDGAWYALDGTTAEGWLCPALFHYFNEPPEEIYLRAEPLAGASCS